MAFPLCASFCVPFKHTGEDIDLIKKGCGEGAHLQVADLSEGEPAIVALVRFHPPVFHHVDFEVVFLRVGRAANCALERLLPRVRLVVVVQVRFRGQHHVADLHITKIH